MSAHPQHADLAQEEDRVSRFHVLAATALILALMAAMVVWAWVTTEQVTTALRPSNDFPEQRLTPATSPRQTREALFGQPGAGERLNAVQRRDLSSYRWIDRSRHIVTLPIEQAMDRIAGESAP
jgi:hypothetical protein